MSSPTETHTSEVSRIKPTSAKTNGIRTTVLPSATKAESSTVGTVIPTTAKTLSTTVTTTAETQSFKTNTFINTTNKTQISKSAIVISTTPKTTITDSTIRPTTTMTTAIYTPKSTADKKQLITSTFSTTSKNTNTTASPKKTTLASISTSTKAILSTTSTTIIKGTNTSLPRSSTGTTMTVSSTTKSNNVIKIEMSVSLDINFLPEYNNRSTSEYKKLEENIVSTLRKQYSEITGFRNVFVTSFRQGSVIVDFVIEVLNGSQKQIEKANENLTAVLGAIGLVTGVPQFYSSEDIKIDPSPLLIYKAINLICSSSEVDVGTVSDAVWKFKGSVISSSRYKITSSDKQSVLKVEQAIPNDAGEYTCTLTGSNYMFHQKVTIAAGDIKQAPVVRVEGQRNVKCQENKIETVQCCVQSGYTVSVFESATKVTDSPGKNCNYYTHTIKSCSSTVTKRITCKVMEINGYDMTTTLTIFVGTIKCNNEQYGQGQEGDQAEVLCPEGQEGYKIAECKGTTWKIIEDTCILTQFKELFIESQGLITTNVDIFSQNLYNAVQKNKTEIPHSSETINTIVNILTIIATVSKAVSKDVMENVLQTVDVLIGNDAKPSWNFLNSNTSQNASSELLDSLESLSSRLNDSFEISTPLIKLVRTELNSSFAKDLNSTVSIEIPFTNGPGANITAILLSTFNNVIPLRNSSSNSSLLNDNSNLADGSPGTNSVFLVNTDQTINNVTLKFKKINENLPLNRSFKCVFWNFELAYNTGAWDNKGCQFVSRINNTVTCSCSHLTSFSVLMSTDISLFVNEPPGSGSGGSVPGQGPTVTTAGLILDIITYIGIGISLASLVICLIIEGYVWKAVTKNSTALMRHIAIVNTALSLLIADICFIVAASYSQEAIDNKDGDFKVLLGRCSAVTFFMHFFYLALFFWMLVSGLLLFYRTMMVFSHMSKAIMIAIGFVVGYGCPLIIAVTTVAATAPSQTYIKKKYICWLNWTESKALLSLVIPALVIVVINLIVVIVVLWKMLRRSSGNTIQPDEKNSFVIIIRCLAILTPLFGLTWALGIGTMVSPKNFGIHVAFAFFNSLQGFFILVFGTLFDSKIRALLSNRIPSTNSISTRSTSGGVSSGFGFSRILHPNRNGNRVSYPSSSDSSGLMT